MAVRQKVWQRLATDLKPRHLDDMARTIAFDDLAGAFDNILKAQAKGRTVVKVGG